MSNLYNVVERVINAETLEEAEDIFYGNDGIKFNRTEYYQNIISNFIKKREVVIKKENGMLYFDLNNINDIWNIIFLAEYIKENDENYKKYKQQLNIIEQEQNELANRVKEQIRNCVKGSNEYIELSKKKSRILKQDKNTKIDAIKQTYHKTLEIFEAPVNIVNLYKGAENLEDVINELRFNHSSINKRVFEDLKTAIYIIYKFRNTFEHGEEILPEAELKIGKQGFKFNIPIKYLEGFNKGRIIVDEKDKIVLKKTNQKVQPILEYLGYDIKKIESFFYNVEPIYLSYLLKKVNYDYNKLYELPHYAFEYPEGIKKLMDEYGISLNIIKELPEGAFWHPENVKKLMDYKLSLDVIKELPRGFFTYPENVKKLMDYKLSLDIIKELPYYAFRFAERFNNLINEYEIPLEIMKELPIDVFYNLPSSFFSFLTLTKGMKLGNDIHRKLWFGYKLKEENLKFLIEKVGYSNEILEEFPVEFFECDFFLLEEMYKRYNSNLNKSIFGIDNPKIISLLVYMHSVFSKIDEKNINIDLSEFILKTNYNTLKYKDNIKAINMDQGEYINQIYNYNILEKLRNMSVHFRFKPVKDENNEDNLLYLYDEDNQGNNNFNIIININDLLEITKNIENQINNENIDVNEKNKTR